MKKIQHFGAILSLLVFTGINEFVQASSDSSNNSKAPGFKLIGSLLTIGVIAFLAPLLRREKLAENN